MNYNDSGIECSYIQNLTNSIYTPNVRVLQNKADAYEGELFIYKKGLYKKVNGSEELINTYNPGYPLMCITNNHTSTSNTYTSDLHESLGDYLRFIRDYYRVDLMSLYNCFSNRYEDDFHLPIRMPDYVIKSAASLISGYKTGTRLIAIPVKFNKVYDIYCKQPTSAAIQLLLYDKKDLVIPILDTANIGDAPSSSEFHKAYGNYLNNNYKEIPLNSSTPYSIQVPFIDENYKNFYQKIERIVYLFIEVPEEVAEYLVVIENVKTPLPNTARPASNSTLLKNIQTPSKPFSDKLLGYLLNYFITPINEIEENIDRIQKALTGSIIDNEVDGDDDNIFKYSNVAPGVYDNYTAAFIYNKYRNATIPSSQTNIRDKSNLIEDFIGYVDKDVEDLILQEAQRKEREKNKK